MTLRLTPIGVCALGSIVFAAGLVLPIVKKFLTPRVSRVNVEQRREVPQKTTIIIPAYLERGTINSTISYIREQVSHYESEVRILVIASDQETADTVDRSQADVIFQHPAGKLSAINTAIGYCQDELVVLTDANCRIEPDNWLEIARQDLIYADLVSGVKFESSNREAAYWAFEWRMRSAEEGELTDTVSVVGEFLAFRANDYQPISKNSLVDDIAISMNFNHRGLRTAVDPRIHGIEPEVSFIDQIERRVRICSGTLEQAVPCFFDLIKTENGYDFIIQKLYRSTIGAAGFWMAAIAAAYIAPPTSAAVVLIGLGGSVVFYATATPRFRQRAGVVAAVMTAVTLQFTPPLALARIVRKHILKSGVRMGWKKVAR